MGHLIFYCVNPHVESLLCQATLYLTGTCICNMCWHMYRYEGSAIIKTWCIICSMEKVIYPFGDADISMFLQ